MSKINYRYYADDDYRYFMASIEHGLFAERLGAQAQEICEKYLKHLLDEYCSPSDGDGEEKLLAAMRTHNLNTLINVLGEYGISLPDEDKKALLCINGYYFTTRYPSFESHRLSKDDLELCVSAIKACKNFVDEYEKTASRGGEEPVGEIGADELFGDADNGAK